MALKQRSTRKSVRKTLLVVGDGDCEEVFLKHLRELYCCRGMGVNVTVRNAHGKGPDHVVDYAIRQSLLFRYDACVTLLDTDIAWTDQLKQRAKRATVSMVGSVPCFEGLLLSILGMRVPTNSSNCKKVISNEIKIDLTERNAYAKPFSKPVLDVARLKVGALDELLGFF